MIGRLCFISVLFLFILIAVFQKCNEGYQQTLQGTRWSVQKVEVTEEDRLSFTTNLSVHFKTKDTAEFRLKTYMTKNPKLISQNQVIKRKYRYDPKKKSGILLPNAKFHINKFGKMVLVSEDEDEDEKFVLTRS